MIGWTVKIHLVVCSWTTFTIVNIIMSYKSLCDIFNIRYWNIYEPHERSRILIMCPHKHQMEVSWRYHWYSVFRWICFNFASTECQLTNCSESVQANLVSDMFTSWSHCFSSVIWQRIKLAIGNEPMYRLRAVGLWQVYTLMDFGGSRKMIECFNNKRLQNNNYDSEFPILRIF